MKECHAIDLDPVEIYGAVTTFGSERSLRIAGLRDDAARRPVRRVPRLRRRPRPRDGRRAAHPRGPDPSVGLLCGCGGRGLLRLDDDPGSRRERAKGHGAPGRALRRPRPPRLLRLDARDNLRSHLYEAVMGKRGASLEVGDEVQYIKRCPVEHSCGAWPRARSRWSRRCGSRMWRRTASTTGTSCMTSSRRSKAGAARLRRRWEWTLRRGAVTSSARSAAGPSATHPIWTRPRWRSRRRGGSPWRSA